MKKQHHRFLWPFMGCLSVLMLLLHMAAYAQPEAQIKGMVLNEKGETMPGVTVQMNETGSRNMKVTITSEKGLYTFEHLKPGTKYDFVFSAVGYDKNIAPAYQVEAGDNNSLLVRMKLATKALSDVVIIGYGQQSRNRVTGVISQVKSKDLAQYSGANFAQQLAGKAAGVVINDASAQPGSDPQIVIRGIGTLTAGRSPLIVVDGFPLTEGSSLNSINPNDIASIDILKDPASAAIYGSRAANGVILISTKKGKSDQFKISLDVYTGMQARADNVKYVDAYDAATFFTEARDWGYVSKNPANRSIEDDRATRVAKGASLRELRLNYLDPYLEKQPGLTNTNWLDEIFRKGQISSYNLALSGGSAKTNYYVGVNYFDQQGLVINNGLKRYSGTVRVDSKMSDQVDMGISINPSFNNQQYFNNNADWSADPIAAVQINYPFFKPYNTDGTLNISEQIKANTPEDGALAENAVALAREIKNNRLFFRNFGNAYLTYKILDGLKFKTLLGGDIVSSMYDFYNPSNIGQYRGAAPKAAVTSETKIFNYNYLWENTLTYTHSFGKHDLDLLGGYTFQKETGSNTFISGTGVADDNIKNVGGASSFTAVEQRYTWVQLSYLARAQYAYADKYLLSASIRRDGSSRFGNDRKWGNFPSFTAGWVLSKENFFPASNAVTFAKIRATWGQSGNNQIGSYSSFALVTTNNYVFGGTIAPGFAATTTSNANLSWETKTSSNIGLDLGLWSKLQLTADYYNSITKDLLLNVPIPDQSGYSTSIQNIGKVQNSGLEIELSGSDIHLGPLVWNFSANLATNRNEVKALAPGQTQVISGADANFRTRVGGPVAELYGYKVTGVYKTQEQITNSPHMAGTLTGDYIVADVNKDGQITPDDRTGFGTYNPKFTYGFSNGFSYKGIELNFSLLGVQGRKIYDRQMAFFDESGEGFSLPSQYYFDHRYHPVDNPDGFFAQPNLGNFSNSRKLTRTSNMYFKKADYLRLRSMQLAYTLPAVWLKQTGISAARIYVSGNNLFTITQFKGYNPDATSTENVLTNGLSNANYPVAKSLTIGCNVTF